MPEHSIGTPHISDTGLILFLDGELPAHEANVTETHLQACGECRARLDALKHGADSYDAYHAQLLKPSLDVPQEWSTVSQRLSKVERSGYRSFPAAATWWAAAALLGCCLVISWLLYRESPTRRTQQLLTRAALAPKPRHHRLQITANRRIWYRPATLEDESAPRQAMDDRGLEETRALFLRANYSWDDPLSARSFLQWRRNLASKRDHVFSIQDSPGKNSFYRLETETPAGVLRMAALTLRADTLSPVKGAFHFEHQTDVTIEDAGEILEPARKVETQNSRPSSGRPLLKEVGPAEELRVFAALDAIGADVGESVSVDIAPSKQQIIVAGVGLSPLREQQIRQALAPLSGTQTRFTSGQPKAVSNPSPDTASSQPPGSDPPLRHMLEKQAGGSQQFQAIADNALDATSTILQRAHALFLLAEKFPPPIASQFNPSELETLRSLRHRHAIVIQQSARALKDSLSPFFHGTAAADETQILPDASWDVGAKQLYREAKELDASLGRILAGSYSPEAGQLIWSKLPGDIQTLEALAVSQDPAQ